MPSTLAFLLPDTQRAPGAVRDDATGLFSACGFVALGGPVLRQRRRQGRPSALVHLRLHDRAGSLLQPGWQAFAQLLQLAFDGSDLLCHQGQGRFVVLSGWVGEAVERPLLALRLAGCGRRGDGLCHSAIVRRVEPAEDDLPLLLREAETDGVH
ncbi:hypothetical protein [Aquabacterium sp. J223]|uniref:hypothetical protein n=1 Tax=Aquabacterium sp. J223 TaxID=2898431 RepID=UPI0021ADEB7E|nr:hypothetical protein [Aquabacterium sp. J223]UUX94259.1 hypothetical protein LRS07_13070 [Aquabacterium sp. J223]